MSPLIELEIRGLTGSNSADVAARALRDNPGVTQVEVDAARGRARLTVDRGVIVEHLLESLEAAGFMARSAEENDD